MKKLVIALALVLGCVCLSGCAKTYRLIPVPEEGQRVLSMGGYEIIEADCKDGQVAIGVPPKWKNSKPTPARVAVINKTNDTFYFNPYAIDIFSDSEESLEYYRIFTANEVAEMTRKKFTAEKFVAVLTGVLRAAAAQQAGTSTTTGTYAGYVDNMPYSGVYSSTTYNPYIQQMAIERANQENQAMTQQVLSRQEERIAKGLMYYIQTTNLAPNCAYMGEFGFEKLKDMKTPAELRFTIPVGSEKVKLVYRIEQE